MERAGKARLSNRREARVLSQHCIKRLVVAPRGGLRLGSVNELGGDLSVSGIEENGVSNGRAVLVVYIAHRKLGGGLGARGRPDVDGLNGNDVGIHGGKLVVGGFGVNVIGSPADNYRYRAIGACRAYGIDGVTD